MSLKQPHKFCVPSLFHLFSFKCFSKGPPQPVRHSYLFCFSLQAGVILYTAVISVVRVTALLYNVTAANYYTSGVQLAFGFIILLLFTVGNVVSVIFVSTGAFLFQARMTKFGNFVLLTTECIWLAMSILGFIPQKPAYLFVCVDDRCPSTQWMYNQGNGWDVSNCPGKETEKPQVVTSASGRNLENDQVHAEAEKPREESIPADHSNPTATTHTTTNSTETNTESATELITITLRPTAKIRSSPSTKTAQLPTTKKPTTSITTKTPTRTSSITQPSPTTPNTPTSTTTTTPAHPTPLTTPEEPRLCTCTRTSTTTQPPTPLITTTQPATPITTTLTTPTTTMSATTTLITTTTSTPPITTLITTQPSTATKRTALSMPLLPTTPTNNDITDFPSNGRILQLQPRLVLGLSGTQNENNTDDSLLKPQKTKKPLPTAIQQLEIEKNVSDRRIPNLNQGLEYGLPGPLAGEKKLESWSDPSKPSGEEHVLPHSKTSESEQYEVNYSRMLGITDARHIEEKFGKSTRTDASHLVADSNYPSEPVHSSHKANAPTPYLVQQKLNTSTARTREPNNTTVHPLLQGIPKFLYTDIHNLICYLYPSGCRTKPPIKEKRHTNPHYDAKGIFTYTQTPDADPPRSPHPALIKMLSHTDNREITPNVHPWQRGSKFEPTRSNYSLYHGLQYLKNTVNFKEVYVGNECHNYQFNFLWAFTMMCAWIGFTVYGQYTIFMFERYFLRIET